MESVIADDAADILVIGRRRMREFYRQSHVLLSRPERLILYKVLKDYRYRRDLTRLILGLNLVLRTNTKLEILKHVRYFIWEGHVPHFDKLTRFHSKFRRRRENGDRMLNSLSDLHVPFPAGKLFCRNKIFMIYALNNQKVRAQCTGKRIKCVLKTLKTLRKKILWRTMWYCNFKIKVTHVQVHLSFIFIRQHNKATSKRNQFLGQIDVFVYIELFLPVKDTITYPVGEHDVTNCIFLWGHVSYSVTKILSVICIYVAIYFFHEY